MTLEPVAGSSVVSTRVGRVPLILSAPHAIYLFRDYSDVHKPEDLTGWLADSLGDTVCAGVLTWSQAEVARSARSGEPSRSNRDPNHLRLDELCGNPWNAALGSLVGRWMPWGCLLADLHGRRDHRIGDDSVDASDCDCGLGAAV